MGSLEVGGRARRCKAYYASTLLNCWPEFQRTSSMLEGVSITDASYPMLAECCTAYEAYRTQRNAIEAIYTEYAEWGLLLRRSAGDMWVWHHRTPSPLRGRPNPLTVRSGSPLPRSPRGNVADDESSRSLHALCITLTLRQRAPRGVYKITVF